MYVGRNVNEDIMIIYLLCHMPMTFQCHIQVKEAERFAVEIIFTVCLTAEKM